jgi:hypothetical protein
MRLIPKVTEIPASLQQYVKDCIRCFPGIRRAADLGEQKRIGLAVLKEALANPSLQEKLRKIVVPRKTPKR